MILYAKNHPIPFILEGKAIDLSLCLTANLPLNSSCKPTIKCYDKAQSKPAKCYVKGEIMPTQQNWCGWWWSKALKAMMNSYGDYLPQ